MLLEKTTAFLGGDSSEEEEAEETRAGNSTGNTQGATLPVNTGALKLGVLATGTFTTISTFASTSLSAAAPTSTAVSALVTTPAVACEEKKPQLSQDELEARLGRFQTFGLNAHISACGLPVYLAYLQFILTVTQVDNLDLYFEKVLGFQSSVLIGYHLM